MIANGMEWGNHYTLLEDGRLRLLAPTPDQILEAMGIGSFVEVQDAIQGTWSSPPELIGLWSRVDHPLRRRWGVRCTFSRPRLKPCRARQGLHRAMRFDVPDPTYHYVPYNALPSEVARLYVIWAPDHAPEDNIVVFSQLGLPGSVSTLEEFERVYERL